MNSKKLLLLTSALAAFSMPAFAQPVTEAEKEEQPKPAAISADWLVEWQNEYRADSDDPSIDETNNSFLRSELAPHIGLGENFYIDGNLVLEPQEQVAEVNAGDDIWFDRNGAFVEEVKLNFENGPLHIWGGKFNPEFGKAWDFGRGIWSEDFAEDYEITEKIGAGAAYTFGAENTGEHTLSATAFFADTSALSKSIITKRDRVKLDDGGASNTEDPSSFTVSLDGENVGGVENLTYIVGLRHLAEQDKHQSAATEDENGLVANIGYVVPIDKDLSVDVMAEYAGIRDFEGVKDADRDYYSASAVAHIHENWNVTLGYTARNIDKAGSAGDFDDHLLQVSGGYDFGNGFTVEAGWRGTSEADEDTNIVGTLVRYTHSF